MNDGIQVDIFDKKRSEKALIVKSNKIIEASYRFTISEQKIIAELLSLIRKEDTEFQRYIFQNKDLYILLGIDHWSGEDKKRYLSDVIDKLQKRIITIPEGERTLKPAWLETPVFDEKNHTTSFRVSRELKPYLLQLKARYTSFLKKLTEPFTCMYSFRFFEMFKGHEPHKGYYNRIQDGKYVKALRFGLPDLRNRLQVEDGEYKRFYDFKLRVLLPSRKDVNEKTDIAFEFQPVKTGRNITALDFFVTSKNPEGQVQVLPRPSKEEQPQEKRSLLERLRKLRVSDEHARKTLGKTGAEELELRVEALEELAKKEGLRNPDGALSKACEKRWTSNKRKEREAGAERERKAKEKQERKEAEEKIKKELRDKKTAAANAEFGALSGDEKFDILKEHNKKRFEELDDQGREDFRKEAFNRILVEYSEDRYKSVNAAIKVLMKAGKEHEARRESEQIRLKKEESEQRRKNFEEYRGMSDEDKFSRVLTMIDQESLKLYQELSGDNKASLNDAAIKGVFPTSHSFQTALPQFVLLLQKVGQNQASAVV